MLASEEDISARLSALLLECARACKEDCDVDALEFGLRDSAALTGAVKRAKSLCVVPDDCFSGGMEEFIPVGNAGKRSLSRLDAVAALKRMGFGKTAAYSATGPNGRFSAWLVFSSDGIIYWMEKGQNLEIPLGKSGGNSRNYFKY